MVRLVIAVIFTIIFFTIIFNTALTGDFEDGMAAYDRKDYATALEKFLSAAEQGNAAAQSNLGVLYLEGQGVARDYTRAHMWFHIAAVSGHKPSERGRDLAASKMTAQQIEQAQRMARECRRSNFTKCE